MHLRQPVGAGERIRSSSTSFALQTRRAGPRGRYTGVRCPGRSRAGSVRAPGCRRRGSGRRPRRSRCGSAWPPRGSRSGAPRSPVRTSPPSARGPRRSAARAPGSSRRGASRTVARVRGHPAAPSRPRGAPARSRVRARARGHALRLLAPAVPNGCVSGVGAPLGRVWTMSSASPEGVTTEGGGAETSIRGRRRGPSIPYHVRSAPFSMGSTTSGRSTWISIASRTCALGRS